MSALPGVVRVPSVRPYARDEPAGTRGHCLQTPSLPALFSWEGRQAPRPKPSAVSNRRRHPSTPALAGRLLSHRVLSPAPVVPGGLKQPIKAAICLTAREPPRFLCPASGWHAQLLQELLLLQMLPAGFEPASQAFFALTGRLRSLESFEQSPKGLDP